MSSSRFSIAPGLEPSCDRPPSHTKSNQRQATVLVVEDEPTLREVTAEWVEHEGYRVITAENGAVALQLLRAISVNLLVTDVRMPVMDGVSLLQTVKSSGAPLPNMIFVTGFADITPREAYDLGAEGTLAKPFERCDLAALLRRSLTDRAELWREPAHVGKAPILQEAFESCTQAQAQGRIAFGRGGFCLKSDARVAEGPVRLALDFQADQKGVLGNGIVRWSELRERMIGVEITFIGDNSRTWVAGLAKENRTLSFIPRITRAAAGASA